MYLSRLRVEVGPDPVYEYPGQRWLRNLYHVHQRLCMAFPSPGRGSEAAAGKQVHVRRALDAGFLFRIDPGRDGRPVILVQSALKPDWECAFHNARHFLVDPSPGHEAWDIKVFGPHFEVDQRLRFRLLANPTQKVGTMKREEREPLSKEDLKQRIGRHGRRVPVPNAEELSEWRKDNPDGDARQYIGAKLETWLKSKAASAGFSVQRVAVQPGYSYFGKRADAAAGNQTHSAHQAGRLRAVRYDGVLKITEPAKFLDTLIRGIGPGKAFGFGLLSVAPFVAGS